MTPSPDVAHGTRNQAAGPRATLREAAPADYPRIAALQVRNGLATMPRTAWETLWSTNPACRGLRDPAPIGWILETASGEIVGFVAGIPVAYRLRGLNLRAVVTGSWVTDPGYRGYSMSVLAAVMKQRGIDLFLTNTASALSDTTLRILGWSRVPAGRWDRSYFWVTRPYGFAVWLLGEKRVPFSRLIAGPLSLALRVRNARAERRARWKGCPGEVRLEQRFDGRFDEFWRELQVRNWNVLLAERSRETLEWHFNRTPEQNTYGILTLSRGSRMTAYAIFDRCDSLGLKRVRLMDFQALEDAGGALSCLLSRLLRDCVETGVDVLESAGWPLEALGKPDRVAPYRRTLDAWRYYYRATTEDLRQTLAAPGVWAPSYYDGDASL
jgi:hypothetical protein